MSDRTGPIEWQEISDILGRARAYFLARDKWLLAADANERSMTHKFAEYLQPLFEPLNVDCEYNRDGLEVTKELPDWLWKQHVAPGDTDGSRVYPDIIVHERGAPNNILVIEAKKSNGGQALDIAKLRAFMSPHGLGYRFGVRLMFVTGDRPDILIDRVE